MCVHVLSHNRDPAHNVHLEFVNLPSLDLPGQQVHSVRLSVPANRPLRPSRKQRCRLRSLSHAPPLVLHAVRRQRRSVASCECTFVPYLGRAQQVPRFDDADEHARAQSITSDVKLWEFCRCGSSSARTFCVGACLRYTPTAWASTWAPYRCAFMRPIA